jgi:AcrR family transcriptional regulator
MLGASVMTAKAVTAPGDSPGVSEDEATAPDATDGRLSTPRPMRADAIKNRGRILEAAEEIFATQGVSVPIDTVAERAGLGVGTLYRHFPTKEALFEAIVTARLEQLLESIKKQRDAPDPGEALFSFLREFAAHASAKRDLFEALSSAGIDIKSQCSEMVDEMKRNIDELRERAVGAGALRRDVSTDEMFGLVIGACQAGEHTGSDEAGCQRMVDIVCDGLRSPTPLLRSTSVT